MSKNYRKNVAVIIVNEEGLLLACQRSDVRGAWQFVQGGIEPGESDEEAMLRELEEEIGTNHVEIVAKLSEKIRYDWPEALHDRGYHGQEQQYFLVRMRDVTKLSLERATANEFSQTEWVTVSEFLARIDGFKAVAYRQALEEFQKLHPDLIVAEFEREREPSL